MSPTFASHFEIAHRELKQSLRETDALFLSAVTAAEKTAATIAKLRSEVGVAKLAHDAKAKADGSLVSDADHAAHATLARELAATELPLVSEEQAGGPTPPDLARQAPFFWLADPLDGTRDFLAGETSFAVALALMHASPSGLHPVFGCVVDPLASTCWWAAGEGLNKRSHGKPVAIATLAGPPAATTAKKLRVLGSRSAPSERLLELYRVLQDKYPLAPIERMGSAIKFGLIAEGLFDLYPRFGPTSEWDTAAGQVLLESTGGGVYAIETAASLRYGKDGWRNTGFLAGRTLPLLEEWTSILRDLRSFGRSSS